VFYHNFNDLNPFTIAQRKVIKEISKIHQSVFVLKWSKMSEIEHETQNKHLQEVKGFFDGIFIKK
jgi:hypothetical protein